MKTFQITKYHPQYRTEDGKYLKNEWTSVSDIDTIFVDGMLTEEEYYRIENNHLKAIRYVLNELNSDYLKIVGLEKFEKEIERCQKVEYSEEDSRVYGIAIDGKVLSINDAIILCKLMFRENIWCYLVNKEIKLNCSSDYYMSITVPTHLQCFDKIENELGLYIEEITQTW